MQNVVLGQLIQRRGYGYELADRLRVWFGAMQLSDAAIYAALRALEARGFAYQVDPERDGVGAGRRERVVFDATDRGRDHFAAWMASTARKGQLREELHMQLLVAGESDIPHLIEGLRALERESRDHLARVLATSFDVASSSPHARVSPFGTALVKDALITHLQATVEWAQRARRSLEQRRADQSTVARGRHRP